VCQLLLLQLLLLEPAGASLVLLPFCAWEQEVGKSLEHSESLLVENLLLLLLLLLLLRMEVMVLLRATQVLTVVLLPMPLLHRNNWWQGLC